ncbi:tyrosine-type recombinase/integrase [Prevotella melaninogenica]|uniref:tyrosine-type recombinase/integrase n=1 Tax=Prevotella melaninogenica TaxID=28132 RepID=UPI00241D15E9|nr:tyrosine-type recombinase/integrase [Prevotella melaninogenica]
MQKQLFISEISCNFNLRRPKVINKPTNVYCVVYVGGKQHYFATGLKVLPSQWNKKKQIAEVSNTLTTLDNRNNNILNEKINQLRGYYKEYIEYLCSNPNDTDKLCNFIYKDMKKKNNKQIKASDLLDRALDIIISENELSANTKKNYYNRLNAFKKYIEDSKVDDNLELLTQRGINNYKSYLQEKGGGTADINQKCQFVVRLIMEVLSCKNEFLDYHISRVTYKPIKDKRGKDERTHFYLETEEIEAFNNVTGLNERESIYKDIFVLQCNCGQRVSDLKQLVIGKYTTDEKNFIHLETKKENITAYFPATDTIKQLLDKLCPLVYSKGELHFIKTGNTDINIDNLDKGSLYNNAIKNIAKKANLNRERKYKDPSGKETSKPIHKIISSHCARHTFATIMRDKGFEADEVCIMLGHADDTMVKQVYAHNDDNIKTKKLAKAIKRVESKDEITSNVKLTKTDALQSLFAYDKLKELERMKDNGINILPLSNKCISIIKDTSNLKKAIQLMNTASKEKKEEFINKVKELDKIIWYIAKHTADTTLYNIYEYKSKELGIIDKVTDINLLNDMFQQELINEELEYYSDEAKLERHLKGIY